MEFLTVDNLPNLSLFNVLLKNKKAIALLQGYQYQRLYLM